MPRKTIAVDAATAPAAAPAAQAPEIVEIVHEAALAAAEPAEPTEPGGAQEQHVRFVLGDDDVVEEDEDDYEYEEEDDDEVEEDDLADVVRHLGALLTTEEGEAITDVLKGIHETLDKQTKILYQGLKLLEARLGRSGGR